MHLWQKPWNFPKEDFMARPILSSSSEDSYLNHLRVQFQYIKVRLSCRHLVPCVSNVADFDRRRILMAGSVHTCVVHYTSKIRCDSFKTDSSNNRIAERGRPLLRVSSNPLEIWQRRAFFAFETWKFPAAEMGD
jgi:hypothetical protein